MQLLALLRLGDKIDWAAAAGWLYLLFLLSIGVVGLSGLLPTEAVWGKGEPVRREER